MRIDLRRYWKYPLGLAVGGLLLPASTWVANGLVPADSTTIAAAGAAAPTAELPDSALESRLLRQTAEQVALQRQAAEQAAAEAAAQAAAQKLAEAEAAKAAKAAARETFLRERASRHATRTAEAPAPAPAPPAGADDVWAKLRRCEAGGSYTRNSGNGYYGAYQFAPGTWRSLGYSGLPHEAPPHVQDEAARKLQARSGWGQWPACSRRIGVR